MRRILLPLFALACLALPASAGAQTLSARGANGAQVAVEAADGEKGVQLTITAGNREPQVFDGVGDALVPLRAGGRSGPILAIDVDRDGVDEIFVRTSSQNRTGILIVFRWDAMTEQYTPVSFTEDTGTPRPYLLVHLSQPVSVNGNVVEANNDSTDGARKRLRVLRYQWNGRGFDYSGSN
ncbi:MAG: hypothetical protein KF794_04090 [Xanthobacteraceae bacterium]|nr:hypothetical protein [Xanthobacteraceae bacterium]QYK45882.1 MAG: hypothetical protein KF794_04090 [Xanthobacteraceae bacterium]